MHEIKEGKSIFLGSAFGLFGLNILIALISIITLGIGAPWTVCMQQRWIYDNTVVDGRRMYFDGKGIQLLGNGLKWFFLTIITLGIYSFWLPVSYQKWITKHLHIVGE